MAKDVATIADAPPDLAIMGMDPGELREIVHGNLGPGGVDLFQLDRVKCPSGGATQFEIPDIEAPDGTSYTNELTGVVLAFSDRRQYWKESLDAGGGGNPPDCYSLDGVFGHGDPGGPCSTCPMAQWGSAIKNGKPTKGQACGQKRALVFLPEDAVLPLLVMVPATSMNACKKAFLRISGKGRPVSAALISIKLAKAKNADGIAYAEFVFSAKRFLTREERDLTELYAASASTLLKSSGRDATGT